MNELSPPNLIFNQARYKDLQFSHESNYEFTTEAIEALAQSKLSKICCQRTTEKDVDGKPQQVFAFILQNGNIVNAYSSQKSSGLRQSEQVKIQRPFYEMPVATNFVFRYHINGYKNKFLFFDTDECKSLKEIDTKEEILDLKTYNNSRQIFVLTNGGKDIELYNTLGELKWTIKCSEQISSLAILDKGKNLLVSTTQNGILLGHSLTDMKEFSRIKVHEGPILSIKQFQIGNDYVTLGQDKKLKVTSFNNEKKISEIKGTLPLNQIPKSIHCIHKFEKMLIGLAFDDCVKVRVRDASVSSWIDELNLFNSILKLILINNLSLINFYSPSSQIFEFKESSFLHVITIQLEKGSQSNFKDVLFSDLFDEMYVHLDDRVEVIRIYLPQD